MPAGGYKACWFLGVQVGAVEARQVWFVHCFPMVYPVIGKTIKCALCCPRECREQSWAQQENSASLPEMCILGQFFQWFASPDVELWRVESGGGVELCFLGGETGALLLPTQQGNFTVFLTHFFWVRGRMCGKVVDYRWNGNCSVVSEQNLFCILQMSSLQMCKGPWIRETLSPESSRSTSHYPSHSATDFLGFEGRKNI